MTRVINGPDTYQGQGFKITSTLKLFYTKISMPGKSVCNIDYIECKDLLLFFDLRLLTLVNLALESRKIFLGIVGNGILIQSENNRTKIPE